LISNGKPVERRRGERKKERERKRDGERERKGDGETERRRSEDLKITQKCQARDFYQ